MAFDRRAAVTRSLLGYGFVAGPFYLALGVGQGLLREGFDFRRHALSALANGPWGWVQTLNFALTGAMVLAATAGIARVVPERSRGLRTALALFAAGLLAGAALRADPADGFPPGTPLGMPAQVSPQGLGHLAAGTLAFTALGVAAFLGAGVLGRAGAPGLARLSRLAGVVVLACFYGGAALATRPIGVLGLWLSVVAGFAWLALLARHLYRIAPDPGCEPART